MGGVDSYLLNHVNPSYHEMPSLCVMDQTCSLLPPLSQPLSTATDSKRSYNERIINCVVGLGNTYRTAFVFYLGNLHLVSLAALRKQVQMMEKIFLNEYLA